MREEYLNCDYHLTSETQARLAFGQSNFVGQPRLTEIASSPFANLWDEEKAVKYGEDLFRALFPPGSELLTGYREASAIASNTGKGIRFRLRIDALPPTRLHELHWELLRDAEKNIPLSRSQEVTFLRYANVGQPPPPPVPQRPRILVVIADPINLNEFNLAQINHTETVVELSKAFESLHENAEVAFLERPATIGRIRTKLMEGGGFHVLHILGHGLIHEDRAKLVLEEDDGHAKFVDEDQFAEVVRDVSSLRLVTLMACNGGTQLREDPFGGLAAALMRRYIPAVIAMRREIPLQVARTFTEQFYPFLAQTGQVDAAMNEARQRVYLNFSSSCEWGTPALFMRLEDGRVWRPDKRAGGSIEVADDFPWDIIARHLNRGKVVPIIGPDITSPYLISPRNVAQQWVNEHKQNGKAFPFPDCEDLPRVARYVDIINRNRQVLLKPHQDLLELYKENLIEKGNAQGRARLLHKDLSDVISEVAPSFFDRNPESPHCLLAELPITTYITTTYDSFMSAALKYKKREPHRSYCHWQENAIQDYPDYKKFRNLKGTLERPLVFHLYGYDDPATMVLTEDDYLDFMRQFARVPERIPEELGTAITNSTLLFLGFNLTDLDFRVLWKGVMKRLKESSITRVAILQFNPYANTAALEEAWRDFQEQCCTHVEAKLYPGTMEQFLKKLKTLV
jgi:hypothetical protein